MNEKIERIADEADLYADNYLSSRGEYHPDWHTVRDRTFAELIIKECLSNMKNCDGDLDFAIWKTKKHFGVE
jgi:hypothetical protein